MSSESKQARQAQKEYYQGAIERRRSLLVEKGIDRARIPKDPYLKHLRAELRKTTKRISALMALEKQKQALALRKQQKLEAKTAEKPEDSPEESQKKQKEAKKKEKKKEES